MSTPQTRERPGATGLNQNTSNSNNFTGTTDPTQAVLSRLDGVQTAGTGWRARCPACGGKSRKVAISEGAEGQCLVHCFSCHDARAVVEAIGLTLADLYPARPKAATPAERRAAQYAMKASAWGAALRVIEREAVVIDIAGHELAAGRNLNQADADRLDKALERITRARGVLS